MVWILYQKRTSRKVKKRVYRFTNIR
jgi:hypothetical protein